SGGGRPGARNERPHEDSGGRPQPETATRQRDTLAALANELSTRMAPPPRNRANPGEPARPESRPEPRAEPRFEPRKPAPSAAAPSAGPAAGEAAGASGARLADPAQPAPAAPRHPPSPAAPPRRP